MYDFDRIVKAAESCDFHDAFASDIKRCEKHNVARLCTML